PYDIATGSRREAPEPRQVRGDNTLPERLCALLKQCVDWDRERRPGSGQEIRQEICAIYEELFHQPSTFAHLRDLPSKADGLNNQAVSYVYLGRAEDAVRCWQKALQDAPQHLEATFNYGYWRWQKGEIPDDVYVTQMRELESSRVTDPDYWRCLAWIHLE